MEITITWIPGNECADEAAKHATRRPHHDITIHPSRAKVKQQIKTQVKRMHSAEHANEVANGSPSATWYSLATNGQALQLPPSIHPRVRADIHRLRLGYHCLSEIQDDNPLTFCSLCETPTHKPLLHYMLRCPKTRKLRTPNIEYPHPEHLYAREAAARLLAGTSSTCLIDIVSAALPP